MDGGPQNAFADGETWSPTFEIKDEAKTLWYHPHALGTTAEQVVHGLAGMIIVEDDSEDALGGPAERVRRRRHPAHPAVPGGRHQR